MLGLVNLGFGIVDGWLGFGVIRVLSWLGFRGVGRVRVWAFGLGFEFALGLKVNRLNVLGLVGWVLGLGV